MGGLHCAALAGLVILLGSCATSTDDVAPSVSVADQETGCCDSIMSAAQILDDGGSEVEYNNLLRRVAAESPSSHAETWLLMSVLSEEPFSYENFNPAIDSLDRISDDLNSTCSGLDRMFVDGDGRMRMRSSG